MDARESVIHLHPVELDIAHRRAIGALEYAFVVIVARDRAEEAHARLLGDAELALLNDLDVADNGTSRRGDRGHTRERRVESPPQTTHDLRGLRSGAQHGAGKHQGLPRRARKIDIAEDDVVGIGGVTHTAALDIHIRVDLARVLIDATAANGLERATIGFIDFAEDIVLLAILRSEEIGVATIEHDGIAIFIFVDLPAFKSMMNSLIHGRVRLFARSNRAKLLLIADEDVLSAADFLYDLTREVSSTQRINRGTVRQQHVAALFTVSLLQDLRAFNCGRILFGTRHRVRHRAIVSNIDRARIIALRRLLTLRSSTILRRSAAGLLIFRLRFCYRRLFQLARIRVAYLRLGMPPPGLKFRAQGHGHGRVSQRSIRCYRVIHPLKLGIHISLCKSRSGKG